MDPIWRSTLVEAGCTIVEVPPYADVATICAASGPHIDGMICRMPGPEGITAAVMDASPNLRVIARHGTGVDSVDLVAARERGVIVTHTGAANANAVSEFTFAAILSLTRQLGEKEQQLRENGWGQRAAALPRELADLTLGVVGMGAVGKRVVHAATLGFGMRVLVFSPSVGAARITESGATPVDSLYALLEEADIVSLHGRLSDKTRHMIDAAALARMKAGSVLINTARGALIDEVALAVALTAAAERADADEPSGIAGAALDTFATEPLPADSPLRSVPAARLLLTPHHATQTRGAFRNMAQAAAASIVDILNGVPVDPRRIAT